MFIKNTKDIYNALSIKLTVVSSVSELSIAHSHITHFRNIDHLNSIPHTNHDTSRETDSTTTEDEGRKNTFPTPKFNAWQKKNELTEAEPLKLYHQYLMEKAALHEFKELKRSEGVDVSSFDIKIKENKLDYSLIPTQYRNEFKEFLKLGPSKNKKRRSSFSF